MKEQDEEWDERVTAGVGMGGGIYHSSASSLHHTLIIEGEDERRNADPSWILPERAVDQTGCCCQSLKHQEQAAAPPPQPQHCPHHQHRSDQSGRRRTQQTLSGRRCLHSFNTCNQTEDHPTHPTPQGPMPDKQDISHSRTTNGLGHLLKHVAQL